MTVKVAIDLALDRLFSYEVPEALKRKLAVGQLLSVPFGHREARGFAISVDSVNRVNRVDSVDRVDRVNSVNKVDRVDSVDRVGRSDFTLTQSDLKSDAKSDAKSDPKSDAKSDPKSDAKSDAKRPYVLKPITAIVDETPFFSPLLLELVKRIAAYTASPIESVLRAALPAAVLKRNARAKELLFVEAVCGEDVGRATEDVTGLSGLTKRQRWLYEQVVRLGGGWMQQLCRELQTTPASVKLLAARGLVKIEARAKRRDPLMGSRILPTKPLPLNAEQKAALQAIEGDDFRRETGDARQEEDMRRKTLDGSKVSCLKSFRPVLLFGVTGSGKTEVYLQAIAAELAAGRGAIVMVPEIALTPQTVRRFASRFGARVAVLHSALSDGERYDEWHRIRAGEARVVIGPRSVVWAPVRDLGLIVVDEEHESSYKQDEMPRYHARDVAVLRGAIENARVVLGSATPSLESWMNVKRGKYVLVELKSRAGAGRLPSVRLEDMRQGAGDGRGLIYSRELLDAIRLRLDRGEQTILFLNRRGYSRSAVCAGCGFVVTCPDCGVPYTYHRADTCLRCHVCGGWIPVPAECPECKCPGFDFKGFGTQRAEAALATCFPQARILRMDADSVSRKNSHDDILSAFRRGEADVLLGTQMIAKGLDFPNVTLVGVLNADASLNLPDFRAAERMYQLLAQVAGRAGRAELAGEVLIQSHDVTSPVLNAVVRNDYARFAADELAVRKDCYFPPFCHLAVIGLRSKDLKLVAEWATMYAASLHNYYRTGGGCIVGEATPSALEKADGWYRWQIVLRAASAAAIVGGWRWISAARPAPAALRVTLDIDAYDLL